MNEFSGNWHKILNSKCVLYIDVACFIIAVRVTTKSCDVVTGVSLLHAVQWHHFQLKTFNTEVNSVFCGKGHDSTP